MPSDEKPLPPWDIVIASFRRNRDASGARIGFATVRFPQGLLIRSVAIRQSGHEVFAILPSHRRMTSDGTPVVNFSTGEPLFVTEFRFDNVQAQRSFSAAVVAALRVSHPEAFS